MIKKPNEMKYIKDNKKIFNTILFYVGLAIVIYIILVIATNYCLKYFGLNKVILNGSFALGILAGIPTIYLWSLKEENKQKELEHIEETLKHTKEAYFNERLINILSTEKLKDEHKIYQLETLLNDWILFYNNDYRDAKLRNIAFQIISIIFSFERDREVKKNIVIALNKVIETNFKNNNLLKNWSNFHLKKDYIRTCDFSYLKLFDINLSDADLSSINLNNSIIIKNDFQNSLFFNSDLSKSQIFDCKFNNATLSVVDFSNTMFVRCEFKNITMSNSNFIGSSFFNCNFSNTNPYFYEDNITFFHNSSFEQCIFDEILEEMIEKDETINSNLTKYI